MNVFEYNKNILNLKEKVDKGELTETQVKDTLESLEIPRNEKLDNIANWIEDNDRDSEWAAEKAKEWEQYSKSLKKHSKNLMEFLTQAIDDTGYKQIKTKNHVLKPRNYTPITVIDSKEKLPREFIKVTQPDPVEKADKKAIYQALKAGEEVPGAHLKENRKTTIL